MKSDPAEFDDRLRQVPLPDGLTSRLRAIAQWNDSDLDAQLAAVELPAGMLSRLHGIVDDSLLDDALRSVPVPQGVLARARVLAVAKEQHAWSKNRVVQWAIAASLIALVWSGYLSAIVAFTGSHRTNVVAPRVVWIDHAPLGLDFRQPEPVVSITEDAWTTPLLASTPEYLIPEPSEPQLVTAETSFVSLPHPVEEMQTAIARDGQFLNEGPFEIHWDWLRRQSPAPAERPDWELVAVAPSSTSSALWQASPTQPHLFMIDNSPIFSPGNDRRLEISRPWLSQRTTTFDWACAMVAAGRFPAGESLHVTDFLAAMQYDTLGLPAEQVGWEANAAISPGGVMLHGIRPVLLQISMQTGPLDRSHQPACDLQLVLDISSSMSTGHLSAAQSAMARFFDNLGEQDRVSLLAFGEQAAEQTRWLGSAQRQQWQSALNRLSAAGSGDLGTGLHTAIERSSERASQSQQAAQRLVVVTDTDWEFNTPQQTALKQLASRAQSRQIELHFVHLGPDGQARRVLGSLAEATGGRCHAAGESQEIFRTLLTILADRPPMVARDAAFTVRFDPKQVAAYRLIGDHAPSIVAGKLGDARTLAAGESLTALYETWLRADASGSPVTVEASWNDAKTGQPQRHSRSLAVSEMAASTAESSPSLWLASLAQATAGALRPAANEIETRNRIDQVMLAARNGPSALHDRVDVQRMLNLLQAARETLPDPRGSRAERSR